ncbi:hypothetical protein TNCV_3343631 [Trichonephila clavipes]|nr:hypothetical protein TNCV_3343631 [Trichonephila clavipes]
MRMVTADLRHECITRCFLIDEYRIKKFSAVPSRNSWNKHYVGRQISIRSPCMEESNLNVVTDRPESTSTSFESGKLSSPPKLLPVDGTATCVAVGLHSSCAVYR